jgi:hypothetical protein
MHTTKDRAMNVKGATLRVFQALLTAATEDGDMAQRNS